MEFENEKKILENKRENKRKKIAFLFKTCYTHTSFKLEIRK